MPPELNAQETTPQQKAKLDTSMIFNIVSIVIGLVGIGSGYYFYLQTKEEPNLCYYVNPIKTAIVKAGQTSLLTTYYDNQSIETDVSAAQVHIWNAGKKAIKKDLILKPICLIPEKKILEVAILKTTRDVINFGFEAKGDQRHIPLSWDILEKGDGAVIQLIYEGDTNINYPVFLDGVIEGQKEINLIADLPIKIALPTQKKAIFISALLICLVSFGTGGYGIGRGMFFLFSAPEEIKTKYSKSAKRVTILSIVLCIIGFYMLFFALYRVNITSPFL